MLSLLLSAPLLLPFTENLLASSEWNRRDLVQVQTFEAPISEVAARLAPTFVLYAYGDPVARPKAALAAGPDNVAELGGGSLGLAALFFAFLGVFYGSRRHETWPWLLAGLFFLLVSAKVPVLSAPFEHLPILSITLLTRLNLCWALCAAVLVGYGVEALLRPSRPPALPGLLLPALLLAVVPILLLLTQPLSRAWTGAPLELVALTGALLAAAFLVRTSRQARPLVPLLLLAVCLLTPRVAQFARWIPTASALSFYPDTLGLRFVLEEGGPEGYRIAGIGQALFAGTASFHGLEDIRNNDPVSFHPYDRFLSAVGEVQRVGGLRLLDPDHPALDFLGVRYFFDHPQMGRREGLDVVYLGEDTLIHRNPGALPRVYVPRRVRVAADDETAAALAASIDDFAERVSVVFPSPEGLPPPGEHPNGAARVTEIQVGEGRLRAAVEAEGGALVVTSQPAIPGWGMTLNGEPAEAVSVNGAFLGAVVPPGSSRLEWVYRPRAWTWGLGLFGVGCVLSVLLIVASRRGAAGTTSASR